VADGVRFARQAPETDAAEGLPLHPVIESLSATIGRYLARMEFARMQREKEEKDEAA
jgi:hypothetical protein